MAQPEHWNVDPFNTKEMWLKTIGRDHEDDAETETIARLLIAGQGEHALEVGAGVGRLMKKAARNYLRVTGVDYSQSLVALSNKYLYDYPQCRVILSNGVLLPFADNQFNFAYSFTCFQHMPNISIVRANLMEMHRVLLPHAAVSIQTVHGDPGDKGRYDGVVFGSVDDLAKEFLAAGFRFPQGYTAEGWIWVTAIK